MTDEKTDVPCRGCRKPIPLALSPLPVEELEQMSGAARIECPACGHSDDYEGIHPASIVVLGSD